MLRLAADADDTGLGKETRELAEIKIRAAREGDKDTVSAIATLTDQVQGKPKETVAHEVAMSAPVIVLEGEMPVEKPADPGA